MRIFGVLFVDLYVRFMAYIQDEQKRDPVRGQALADEPNSRNVAGASRLIEPAA